MPGASERRREMVQLAAELFAERGYKATTVRAIGDAAGVLSGSLYHHFDSKEAIADELFASYFDELLATYKQILAAHADPIDRFRELVYAGFEAIGQHRAANIVLQNEGQQLAQLPRFTYLRDRERRVESVWTGVIRDGMRAGQLRDDLEPRMLYRFVRDAIWVAARWYKPTGRLTPRALADKYLTMIMDGVVPR
jgi:AcrR family transcriptional regulator